jgi:ribosomal-protein-alanine N-acetyltransferase
MIHRGTIKHETTRLILRRFTIDDADAMYRNWANYPAMTKYLRWPPHSDVSVSVSVLERWVSLYEKQDYYQWAIVPKELGEPIGCIGPVEQRGDIKMTHIGYALGRKWWRQGYTSEALMEVIRFFFEKVGINRIESMHDPNNPNSGRVMIKCGMKYEGTMRQADISNQGIVDAAMYAILAEDYKAKHTITRFL